MNLTSSNLKTQLWETLQKLRANEIEPETAKAIAMQAREILRIVNTEINLAVLSGKKPNQKILKPGIVR